jgi:hypothetical protein
MFFVVKGGIARMRFRFPWLGKESPARSRVSGKTAMIKMAKLFHIPISARSGVCA